MSVLFANTRATSGGQSGHLLEFKAGRTLIEAGSAPNKVKAVANPAKGLVYVNLAPDQLLHFCWKDRETNKNELDLIVIPGDCTWVNIKESGDGRVYMLKFRSSEQRHLFWMQEPKADKDEELCKKMNSLLNDPTPQRPTARTPASGTDRSNMLSGFAALSNVLGGSGADGPDIGALNNMDQNQIMRLFSMMSGGGSAAGIDQLLPQLGVQQDKTGSDTTATSAEPPTSTLPPNEPSTTAAASAASASGPFSAEMLASVIAATEKVQKRQQGAIDLSAILTRANIQNEVVENADRLAAHLPDQEPILSKEGELQQTIGNPQFQQAADYFGHVLQSGQMGPALQQFGLKDEVLSAADSGDLLKFAAELSKQENPTANVDKEIDEQADAVVESAESAAKEELTSKDKKDAEQKKLGSNPPPKRDEDNMDLD